MGDSAEEASASAAPPEASVGIRRIVVDGAVPLLAFWVARHVGGTITGVLAAGASAGALLLWRHRSGHRGAAAGVSAFLIALNAVVGLVAHADSLYLAQGVLATTLLGVAFAVTAATRRPLAGILAADLYGLRTDVWHDSSFVRTFRTISVVWAGFELLSAGLRASVLSSVDVYVFVSLILGTPATIVLFWWSVRFANRRLL